MPKQLTIKEYQIQEGISKQSEVGKGTVTEVTSANTDIAVATGTITPVLTLNSGTGADQIVKLDGSSKLPAVDGSALTNLPAASGKVVILVDELLSDTTTIVKTYNWLATNPNIIKIEVLTTYISTSGSGAATAVQNVQLNGLTTNYKQLVANNGSTIWTNTDGNYVNNHTTTPVFHYGTKTQFSRTYNKFFVNGGYLFYLGDEQTNMFAPGTTAGYKSRGANSTPGQNSITEFKGQFNLDVDIDIHIKIIGYIG